MTRGSSAPTVSATHAPNDMPAVHIGVSGYRSAMKSRAARKSSISPGSIAERARAGARAAKIEPQDGAANPRERFRRLIDDLRVHRAAVLGVRMREDDGRADRRRRGRVVSSPSALMPRPAAGSSSSASRRPAGPCSLTQRHPSCVVRCFRRSRERATANASGRVITPRWPVRSSTTPRAPEMRRAYVGRSLDRHDEVESRFSRDDERRRRDPFAVVGQIERRDESCALRPSAGVTPARAETSEAARARIASARQARGNARPRAPARNRHGDSATNSGPKIHGARTYTRCRGSRCHAGPRRGREDQPCGPRRLGRGEADRHETAERHAADRSRDRSAGPRARAATCAT